MAEEAETITAVEASGEAPAGDGGRSSLSALALPVRGALDACERLLREELNPPQPWLAGLVGGLSSLGGKRIRPLMSLLWGAAAGSPTPQNVVAATAFEMVHLATLVHDDILDGAELRRGTPTLFRQFGTKPAVLAGDYLFTQSFIVASRTGNTRVMNELAESANQVCSGEIWQNHLARDVHLNTDQYVGMITAKTASLCAGACRAGAILAGAADDLIEAAGRYGLHLGIAFQVTDDCLDLTGSPERVGKTLGTDLAGGKWTLPVIHVLEHAPAAVRSRLLKALVADRPDAQLITGLIHEHGGMSAAAGFVADQISRAVSAAGQALAAAPGGTPSALAREAVLSLTRMAGFVASRSN